MSRNWFRKKGDQLQLDTVRTAINKLEALPDLSIGLPGISVGLQPASLYEGLADIQSVNTFIPTAEIFDFSDEAIRRYTQLYIKLLYDKTYLQSSIHSHKTLLPGMFPEIVMSLKLRVTKLEEKQTKVEEVFDILDRYAREQTEENRQVFVALDQALVAILSHEDLQAMANGYREVRGLAVEMQQVKKSLSRMAEKLAHGIFTTIKRDIRQSYRNLVRLLFKNMDDNSGEAHTSVALKMCVVPNLNYDSNYETEYPINKRYRRSAC